MSRFKLPESLKAWKVASSLPDANGYPVYEVTRKETDGSVTKAKLTYVAFQDDNYNSDNVQLINEETQFIKNVMACGDISAYIDAAVLDRPSKNKIGLFILTKNLPTLASVTDQKSFSEDEVVEFGLQMSELLQKLEAHGINHGNIKPENIFVTDNGKYLLGGFTDFESKIDDLSFIAPEIKDNTQPDYTTDIYSVGLMMYAMCNNNAIPFEGEGVTREQAVEKRFAKESITAPANGSEKLKSIIVIACQPDNRNRWKNAGNLKNALASIKPAPQQEQKPNEEIIAPESTEFEGNVFEESAFDEIEEPPTEPLSKGTIAAGAVAAGAVAAGAAINASAAENASGTPVEPNLNDSEKTVSATSDEGNKSKDDFVPDNNYHEPEIDNRVFDDYQLQTKVFNINDVNKKAQKDYGDFFDDEPEPEPENASDTENGQKDTVDTEFGKNGFYDDDSFYAEQNEEEKRNRKGLIAVIIASVLAVALLAALGVLAATNNWFGGKTEATQPSTAVFTEEPVTTQKPTSAQSTTVPTTTEPETTLSEFDYPSNVIGAYYEYAKEILENEGFLVERGESAESYEYEEGIVTSMYPDPNQELKRGTTITLNVSSGLIVSEDDEDTDNYVDDEEYYDDGEYYDDSEYSEYTEDEETDNNSDNNSNNDNPDRGRERPEDNMGRAE